MRLTPYGINAAPGGQHYMRQTFEKRVNQIYDKGNTFFRAVKPSREYTRVRRLVVFNFRLKRIKTQAFIWATASTVSSVRMYKLLNN